MSDPPDAERDQHLDSLRIRQATVLRRSIYRSRAYAVVAAVACAAASAQCGWLAVRHVRWLGWDARAVAFIVLMIGAIFGTVFFARRAAALSREAAAAVLPEPDALPDFSTLSDGSQRARNLDEVR